MILLLFGKGHTMASWPTLGHGCCFAISHPHLLHTKIHRFSNTHRYRDAQTHIDTQMLKHTLIQILKQTDTQTHRDTQILRYSNTKTHKRTATNTQKHRDTSTDTYRLHKIPVSLCIHDNDTPSLCVISIPS